METFQWYIPLFILGMAFFPFTYFIFGRFFPDRAYPFAKAVALIIISYSALLFGTVKVLPFTLPSLLFLLGGYAILNAVLMRRRFNRKDFSKGTVSLIIFEELLFIACLFAWTFIRGQESSIRGLEKFMDYGFINSILRAQFFPPLDMWLSATNEVPKGFAINYYYFGHLTGALLIKLTNIRPPVGYNLILSTIFALCLTEIFSLLLAIFTSASQALSTKVKQFGSWIKNVCVAIVGSYLITLGGNLHTIYLFTKGYDPDSPVPFWKILSFYNPLSYWYPNATRFIPFTIHEFPSYSYVVADLHGHVFDIPFVLLTISVLFVLCLTVIKKSKTTHSMSLLPQLLRIYPYLPYIVLLGFLTGIHYMTNALDGPIYLLLSVMILFSILADIKKTAIYSGLLTVVFAITTLPFSLHFKPFASGIGVNCSPDFLSSLEKIGPFIFEKGNCQTSPVWMLFVLWGFFMTSFAVFIFTILRSSYLKKVQEKTSRIHLFILILFTFGLFLIIIPEFFYVKDIYPAHFRANTMFKLGYQAFILMGIASVYTFFLLPVLPRFSNRVAKAILIILMAFIAVYPFYSVQSYYGKLDRPVELDGAKWIEREFPQDKEIIDYLNTHVSGQPVILEAQGDSYTDYERISSYTGLPTVAGWWVHEWLWRGSSSVVGDRIPDIELLYRSPDLKITQDLVDKYRIQYVIVSVSERSWQPHF